MSIRKWNAETVEQLRAMDEISLCGYPKVFNPDEIETRARQVVSDLKEELGTSAIELENDGYDVRRDQATEPGLTVSLGAYHVYLGDTYVLPVIRISNYTHTELGTLASYTCQELLPNWVQERIVKVLTLNGFWYVPRDELYVKYDGKLKVYSKFPSWWVRYLGF